MWLKTQIRSLPNLCGKGQLYLLNTLTLWSKKGIWEMVPTVPWSSIRSGFGTCQLAISNWPRLPSMSRPIMPVLVDKLPQDTLPAWLSAECSRSPAFILSHFPPPPLARYLRSLQRKDSSWRGRVWFHSSLCMDWYFLEDVGKKQGSGFLSVSKVFNWQWWPANTPVLLSINSLLS